MPDMLARRRALLGPNVPLFYEEPVHIVRGEGVWLWDADGNRYLDCYNNVPHVGHCNPRVVDAICKQAATLNTHTRYLHDGILDYGERLTAKMPESLSTLLLTCTGSEANDVAMRMAEGMTGARGIIATDATYHGNTALVSQLSRSNIPEVGFGLGDYIRHIPAPDSYRAPDPGGAAFAASLQAAIDDLNAAGHGFAALVICPHFVNEGFPDLPKGWLDAAARVVRAAGGLLIADEVQPGFGRIGSHFWGFERQGITPDIVTLGKPMANGHPVGGVVTRPEIMARFREAFRYFNTFGGNPVSCAAALAVLDELHEKALPEQAARVGAYARERLSALMAKYEAIGDVRGEGMLFGAELVTDRSTKAPATALTTQVFNEMRQRGCLMSSLGRGKNTLKIRPPLPFAEDHAEILFDTLDAVLCALAPS